LLCVQFVIIYGGANLLSQHRSDVYHLYFDWELAIPLVPSMVWIYASITPLMLLPLFYLDRDQLTHLAKQLALAMLIAGIVFLLFPATLGYERAPSASVAIELIRSIDLPYNLVPSLHVALSAIIMLHLYPTFGKTGRFFLSAWVLAMISSVLLTHQHHLADVLGGLVLASLCFRLPPNDDA
jgi:membrane-associated phospholipid phosphatase